MRATLVILLCVFGSYAWACNGPHGGSTGVSGAMGGNIRLMGGQWRLGLQSRYQHFRIPSMISQEPSLSENRVYLLNKYGVGSSLSAGYGINTWLQADVSVDYFFQGVRFWSDDVFEDQAWHQLVPVNVMLTAHVFEYDDAWQLSFGMGGGMPMQGLTSSNDSNIFAAAGGWSLSGNALLGWQGEQLELSAMAGASYRFRDFESLLPGLSASVQLAGLWTSAMENLDLKYGVTSSFSHVSQWRLGGSPVLNTGGNDVSCGALLSAEWTKMTLTAGFSTPIWQYRRGEQSTQLLDFQVGVNFFL